MSTTVRLRFAMISFKVNALVEPAFGGAARLRIVIHSNEPAPAPAPIRSFVALGDSFTEGLMDANPDGTYRGWADLVAQRLDDLEPGLLYANLSVRGKLMRQIEADQIAPAVEMRADLVTLAGGLNDIARPGCDIEAVCASIERCVRALAPVCSRILMFHSIDFSHRMPSMNRYRPKVVRLMECVEALRAQYGVIVVDLSPVRVFDDPRLWAPDRVHLNGDGHARIAEAVLEALGRGARSDWQSALPPARPQRALGKTWDDLVWLAKFLAPWIKRRLTGKSSGDGMPPKRAQLEPLRAAAAASSPAPAAASGQFD